MGMTSLRLQRCAVPSMGSILFKCVRSGGQEGWASHLAAQVGDLAPIIAFKVCQHGYVIVPRDILESVSIVTAVHTHLKCVFFCDTRRLYSRAGRDLFIYRSVKRGRERSEKKGATVPEKLTAGAEVGLAEAFEVFAPLSCAVGRYWPQFRALK